MATRDTHSDISLDEHLRRAISFWCARHGVSARYFGVVALGYPDLPASQMRGRSMRLETADRVLAFMGEPLLGLAFRDEVEAFLAVTGTKFYMLGEEAVGNPSFVSRLRRGASPRLKTVDRVRAWMAAHASEDELCAIRERLTHTYDKNHLAGQTKPGDSTRRAPTCGAELEQEGEIRMNENGGNYLNTREAASWLRLSPRTLEHYRVSGGGPVFHRFGSRVRYLLADLEDWASARRRKSTSDDGGRIAR